MLAEVKADLLDCIVTEINTHRNSLEYIQSCTEGHARRCLMLYLFVNEGAGTYFMNYSVPHIVADKI